MKYPFVKQHTNIEMETIRLDKSLPVILIDTSYYIFYRYYSSLKWYQFQNKEIDYAKIHEDSNFMDAFYKHISAELDKIVKKWKTKKSQIIFCCDCSRENIWRNQHTDAYKQTRTASQTFNPNIFFKFYQYIENKQGDWGFHKVLVEHLEADDVAYLSKKMLCKNGCEKDIYIITNDNDYLQLLDSQTKIFNLTGSWNDLSKRSCGDPAIDLKKKLIMGDKSDNIVAIHSGIGEKTVIKILDMDNEEFERYLDEKGCRTAYERNRTLVDFRCIPQEYQDTFESQYTMEWNE